MPMREALEAANFWLEAERDNPGQATPNEILRVIDEALASPQARYAAEGVDDGLEMNSDGVFALHPARGETRVTDALEDVERAARSLAEFAQANGYDRFLWKMTVQTDGEAAERYEVEARARQPSKDTAGEPRVIYLEPRSDEGAEDFPGRQCAETDLWNGHGVEYVRAVRRDEARAEANCVRQSAAEFSSDELRMIDYFAARLSGRVSDVAGARSMGGALVENEIRAQPYPEYSYVAQNRAVEVARATKYARTVALRTARALRSASTTAQSDRETMEAAVHKAPPSAEDLYHLRRYAERGETLRPWVAIWLLNTIENRIAPETLDRGTLEVAAREAQRVLVEAADVELLTSGSEASGRSRSAKSKEMFEARAGICRTLSTRIPDAIRALPSASDARQSGWQPIETALRDGTLLLLFTAGENFVEYDIGSFHEGEEGDGEIGWFTVGGADIDPSYWQRLPRPPTAKAEGR